MIDLSRWKHRCVRDLAWVIASPSLVSGRFSGVEWWDTAALNAEYLSCLDVLEQLDKDPLPLKTHLNELKSKALGHRFEALVAYWLGISPNYNLIDRNIQIQGDGRTLGELDFIIRDCRTDVLIHLEVSVKFYMGISELRDPMNWYGSNLNDSFGKKIDHLKQHQTQLTQLYPEKIKYSVDQRCCLVKGRLFYPESLLGAETSGVVVDLVGLSGSSLVSPTDVADGHLTGVWGEDASAFALRQPENIDYFPVQKQEWLSEFIVSDERLYQTSPPNIEINPNASTNTFLNRMNDPTRPKCYVLMNQGNECMRYFQFPAGYFDSVRKITDQSTAIPLGTSEGAPNRP